MQHRLEESIGVTKTQNLAVFQGKELGGAPGVSGTQLMSLEHMKKGHTVTLAGMFRFRTKGD